MPQVNRPDADAGVAALFVSHRLGMVRLAMLLVDDLETAQDVVQDAFVELHRRWDRLDNLTAAPAYLRTCVVNGSRSLLRRRATARRYPHAGLDVGSSPPPEEAAMQKDEYQQVLDALATLPSRQREVIVLRYWSQLSEQQIADTLGISAGAVKSSASRGRDAIAARMGNRP